MSTVFRMVASCDRLERKHVFDERENKTQVRNDYEWASIRLAVKYALYANVNTNASTNPSYENQGGFTPPGGGEGGPGMGEGPGGMGEGGGFPGPGGMGDFTPPFGN